MMVVVVMGVAGSGKTTLAALLADALGGECAEGDRFHPPANIEKMTSGQPLTDADRQPWLEAMADAIETWRTRDKPTVLACSALRQQYRDVLARGSDDVKFVYLRVTPQVVTRRMASRKGHFMPTSLVASQFATLEEPTDAIVLDGLRTPSELVAEAIARLRPLPEGFDAQADAIKAEILDGHSTVAEALFTQVKLPSPSHRWNPGIAELPAESLRFLLDYWNRLRGERSAPATRAIDPVDMRPILGNLMLVDVEDGGRRFRYALYGARLVDLAAFDWTGRTTREMADATRMPGPIFYDACYRAVYARPQPLLTISHGAPMLVVRTWARLILPLGEPVARFLVGNVPVLHNTGMASPAAYAATIRRHFEDPSP